MVGAMVKTKAPEVRADIPVTDTSGALTATPQTTGIQTQAGTTVSPPPIPAPSGAFYNTLPWESRAEFTALRHDMYMAYQPVGPVECHLLDELAMTMWRKRRYHDAENAAIRERAASLVERQDYDSHNTQATYLTRAALLGVDANQLPDNPALRGLMTAGATDQKAADKARKAIAYWEDLMVRLEDRQLSARVVLRDALTDWRKQWKLCIEGEEYERNADGVAEFIKDYPLQQAKLDLLKAHGHEVREHIAGRAFLDHSKQSAPLLLKFEAHLDSKTRKTLDTLLQLQRARLGG